MNGLYPNDFNPNLSDKEIMSMISELREELQRTRNKKRKFKKKGGRGKKYKRFNRRIKKMEKKIERLMSFRQMEEMRRPKGWAESILPQLVSVTPKILELLLQPKIQYPPTASPLRSYLMERTGSK